MSNSQSSPRRKRLVLVVKNASKKSVTWWDWFAAASSPRWKLNWEDVKAVIRAGPSGAIAYLLAIALREVVNYFSSPFESGGASLGDYLLVILVTLLSMAVTLLRKWAGAVSDDSRSGPSEPLDNRPISPRRSP
jgi:hypothetical protein